jgi:DNA-binding PadR family transcriptional regulator
VEPEGAGVPLALPSRTLVGWQARKAGDGHPLRLARRRTTDPCLPVYLRRRYIEAVETPLREPTFLILTALAGGLLHGYGLIAEVARLSENRITLRPGTLYGALDRLVDAGLVAVDSEEVVEGRLRRYYRLSEPGRGVLAAETERMRRNVEAASIRLRALPRPGRSIVPRLGGGMA